MKGSPVDAHYSVMMTPREAEAIRRLFEELKADAQFPLNEFEEEIVAGLLEILSAPINKT